MDFLQYPEAAGGDEFAGIQAVSKLGLNAGEV
jgi:hypothetical protein